MLQLAQRQPRNAAGGCVRPGEREGMGGIFIDMSSEVYLFTTTRPVFSLDRGTWKLQSLKENAGEMSFSKSGNMAVDCMPLVLAVLHLYKNENSAVNTFALPTCK